MHFFRAGCREPLRVGGGLCFLPVLLNTNIQTLASDVLYTLGFMTVTLGPEETVPRLNRFKDKKFMVQNIWKWQLGHTGN